MKAWLNLLLLFTLVLPLLLGCQPVPPPPAPTLSPILEATQTQPVPTPEPTPEVSFPSPQPPQPTRVSIPELETLEAHTGVSFASTPRMDWAPSDFTGLDFNLPVDLSQAANLAVISALSAAQQAFLSQNGFVVIHSQEAQFGDIRHQVSNRYGQPYYLTTDAASHALQLTLNEVVRALEREELRPRLTAVVQAMLNEVLSYYPLVADTQIEGDVRLAAAYLSVGLKLLSPESSIDSRLANQVTRQIEQVISARGREPSMLIPGFEDDYSAYRPTGHYAGDIQLESYFQALTWFKRVRFQWSASGRGFTPSRTPLVLTLALRRARMASGTAAEEWLTIHEILTFLFGPSSHYGPLEYASLMDSVYGPQVIIPDLQNEQLWKEFQERRNELPHLQVNSTLAAALYQAADQPAWCFLSHPLPLDSLLLQQLASNQVGSADRRRKLPSGLDFAASLGSTAALRALEKAGETNYAGYRDQLHYLQEVVRSQNDQEWLNTAFSSWMFAFLPQLAKKGSPYPRYMQTEAWAYKELNSGLGSWVDLKSDAVISTRLPALSGLRTPRSGPAPGYVEPNPSVFFRLAYLAEVAADGLLQRNIGVQASQPPGTTPFTLMGLLADLKALGIRFQKLGDIAARELAGIPTEFEDDRAVIQDCLGPVECLAFQTLAAGTASSRIDPPSVPAIAVAAGTEDLALSVGIGFVDRIYVVVPLEGKMQIAQGGVYSYYEFSRPRKDILSSQDWYYQLIATTNRPAQPDWTTNFVLPGGQSKDSLAFRVGDVFTINASAANQYIYESASAQAAVLDQLRQWDTLQITGGPILSEGFTWWKIADATSSGGVASGWIRESQTGFERIWGQ